MGFNNAPSRGSSFIKNVNTRFSELIVRAQLIGLLKDEYKDQANMLHTSIKAWFEGLPMAVNDKPRFKDDLPSNMFWDNNPKRILLSKYKDHKGQDFIAIGMNYGVLVGKTIVQALGGHDIVCRIIATGGLIGLWDAVQAL